MTCVLCPRPATVSFSLLPADVLCDDCAAAHATHNTYTEIEEG